MYDLIIVLKVFFFKYYIYLLQSLISSVTKKHILILNEAACSEERLFLCSIVACEMQVNTIIHYTHRSLCEYFKRQNQEEKEKGLK